MTNLLFFEKIEKVEKNKFFIIMELYDKYILQEEGYESK